MFNAASYFVDRHIEEGREGSTAIECADRRLSSSIQASSLTRLPKRIEAAPLRDLGVAR